MAWRGSLSRSLMATTRASVYRSSTSPSVPCRLRAPALTSPRRHSFVNRRTLGALGCAQSMMPLHSVVAAKLTSHLAVNVRACRALSQGWNGKDG